MESLYFIWQYKGTFLSGLLMTLELTALASIFGSILGIPLAIGRLSNKRYLRYISIAYIEIFLALPLLVLLIWVYFALPILIKPLVLSGFWAAVIAMSLNLAPFVAETVRAGIESIPKGQFEAAIAVGMSTKQAFLRIIFPQAIRRVVPPLLTQYITTLKLSSLASVIAVYELVYSASNLISTTFRPMEVYTTVAIVYLMIILPLSFAVRFFEKRYILRT